MRKRIVYIMVGVMLSVSILVGCGKEVTKDKETTSTTIEVSWNELEVGALETAYDVTSGSETTEQPITTINKQEITTVKQETMTTKKQETTTVKQEVTTTKKQETTTVKQEVTTTKKQETTTAKQEEITTRKEEETTTASPVVVGSWFEQKGYTITAKAEATRQVYRVNDSHSCTAMFDSIIDTDKWLTSKGLMSVGVGFSDMWCDYEHDLYEVIPFDRYTGIAYEFNGDKGEFEVDGETITYEISGTWGGGCRYVEVICPIEYDGVVFLVAKSEKLTYKGEELIAGAKMYTIDEVYDFDIDDVFFMSVDDK